jgi:hypothetical protein
VLTLDQTARRALAVGDDSGAEAALHALRYESYRQASLAWEDPWWLARVAGVEELEAERARQQADWPEAWASWRSGWWVRQLLARDGGRPQRRRAVWSSAVMGALHLAVGRPEDGVRRIREALEPWSELGLDAQLQAELRAAVGLGEERLGEERPGEERPG